MAIPHRRRRLIFSKRFATAPSASYSEDESPPHNDVGTISTRRHCSIFSRRLHRSVGQLKPKPQPQPQPQLKPQPRAFNKFTGLRRNQRLQQQRRHCTSAENTLRGVNATKTKVKVDPMITRNRNRKRKRDHNCGTDRESTTSLHQRISEWRATQHRKHVEHLRRQRHQKRDLQAHKSFTSKRRASDVLHSSDHLLSAHPFQEARYDPFGVHSSKEFIHRGQEVSGVYTWVSKCPTPVLLLFGPDGSGRRTLMRYACRNYAIVEWDACQSLTTDTNVSLLKRMLLRKSDIHGNPIIVVATDAAFQGDVPDGVAVGDIATMLHSLPRHNPFVVIVSDLRGTPYSLFRQSPPLKHRIDVPNGTMVRTHGRCMLVKLPPFTSDHICRIAATLMMRLKSRGTHLPPRHHKWWKVLVQRTHGNGHIMNRMVVDYLQQSRAQSMYACEGRTDVAIRDMFEAATYVLDPATHAVPWDTVDQRLSTFMDAQGSLTSSPLVQMVHHNLCAALPATTSSMDGLSEALDKMAEADILSKLSSYSYTTGPRTECARMLVTWGVSATRARMRAPCKMPFGSLSHYRAGRRDLVADVGTSSRQIQKLCRQTPAIRERLDHHPAFERLATKFTACSLRSMRTPLADVQYLIVVSQLPDVKRFVELLTSPQTPASREAKVACFQRLQQWAVMNKVSMHALCVLLSIVAHQFRT